MASYYCLMAGLPEINFSDPKPGCDMEEFMEQLHEALVPWDARLMAKYYFMLQDCRNLVALLKDPEADIKYNGNFNKEQYKDLITSAQELNFNVHRYPAFMSEFAREWNFNKDKKGYFPEDEMLCQFYEYAINTCSNEFVRSWYQLNMDINNILTAMLAAKQGWKAGDYIKGEGEVQTMIRENNAKDFIRHIGMDNVQELKKIVEETDPVKKEKMIDTFKWLWLDEQTFFDPFNFDAVFAYMCKLEMQYRWANLDVEHGKARFQKIIDDLRGSAQVPDEYKRKGA